LGITLGLHPGNPLTEYLRDNSVTYTRNGQQVMPSIETR